MTGRLACLLALILLIPGSARAGVPSVITIQGKLTDSNGVAPPPGGKSFTFRIYDDSVAGAQVWPQVGGEVQTITTSIEGLWTGLVGALNPLTSDVFGDTLRWLEIIVDGTTLPRVRLATGPYAHRVATVDGATGGNITTPVSIGPGHTASGAYAFVAGEQNTALGDDAVIAGGASHVVTGDYATIGGGFADSAKGAYSTVGGGQENVASGVRATVGGGFSNETRNSYATIAGGFNNTASGGSSAVGGGSTNRASGIYATVPGGFDNEASGFSSLAAGRRAHAVHGGTFVWADS
ncbi:MAG: hypothetical protein AB1752_14600, partial [Candidatus Zixiibacteriota bacterium]